MGGNRWEDARRLEAWAGETRVNLLRAAALVVFYGHHLLNVHVFGDPTLDARHNAAVTTIVLVWSLLVLILYRCLSRRWMPPALKYVATAWDLVSITALLMVNPDGPHSALVVLYFLVVAAAPLRLSLPLVWASTLGAWAAGVFLMGYYVYFRVGVERYYAPGSSERIARSSEIIFLLALGAAGLFAGQMVRQARRLVRGYPVVVEDAGEGM